MLRLAALSMLLLGALFLITLRLIFSAIFALSGVRRHRQVLDW